MQIPIGVRVRRRNRGFPAVGIFCNKSRIDWHDTRLKRGAGACHFMVSDFDLFWGEAKHYPQGYDFVESGKSLLQFFLQGSFWWGDVLSGCCQEAENSPRRCGSISCEMHSWRCFAARLIRKMGGPRYTRCLLINYHIISLNDFWFISEISIVSFTFVESNFCSSVYSEQFFHLPRCDLQAQRPGALHGREVKRRGGGRTEEFRKRKLDFLRLYIGAEFFWM